MKRIIILLASVMLIGCRTESNNEQSVGDNETNTDVFDYKQTINETENEKKVRTYTLNLVETEEISANVPLKSFFLTYLKGGDTYGFQYSPEDNPSYSIRETIKYRLLKKYGSDDIDSFTFIAEQAYHNYLKEINLDEEYQYDVEWSFIEKGRNLYVDIEQTLGYGIPALYYSHEVMCKNSKKCTLTITYEDSVFEVNNSSNSEGTINNRGTYSIEFYVPKTLSIEFNEYQTYEEYLDFYKQYDGIICETITEKLR